MPLSALNDIARANACAPIEVSVGRGDALRGAADVAWRAVAAVAEAPFGGHPGWLRALASAMGHEPFWLQATSAGQVVGQLPLALVASRLFGRFLVSLPYVNTAGVSATSVGASLALVDRAVTLADELDVRYLELRHEHETTHPALTERQTSKVHMRLPLPGDVDTLWNALKAKVRNQIRKGESSGLSVHWGRGELLRDFYHVFARNMRDLGTPVFPRLLFAAILEEFSTAAELCVARLGAKPIAAALVVHGPGRTEVPSASSLRAYNSTCANMLMYWHLLRRAVERGQAVFDFGRSSVDGPTFKFKKQWGAQPAPAVWQYYVRRGDVGEMRPENRKYQLMIRTWQRLPVWLTRWLGPMVVRGIP